jgi:hypothetical protein
MPDDLGYNTGIHASLMAHSSARYLSLMDTFLPKKACSFHSSFTHPIAPIMPLPIDLELFEKVIIRLPNSEITIDTLQIHHRAPRIASNYSGKYHYVNRISIQARSLIIYLRNISISRFQLH